MNHWLDHPSYSAARDRLIQYLRADKYRFRPLDRVVFLCGAMESVPRDTLRNYLASHFSDVSIFYAEQVWTEIASNEELSALQMEDYLARLADLVIILVESPGTFTELGAFSLSDILRKKLLPVMDVEFRNTGSFIETGPIRWINKDSGFGPAIYVDLRRILEAVDEFEKRLDRIPDPVTTRVSDLADNPKQLLFFVCDLVSVIEPATFSMIEYYLRHILPNPSRVPISTLVGLALAMGLLKQVDLQVNGQADRFFYRPSSEGLIKPFHHQRWLDLPSQRAAQVAVLQTIPAGSRALRELWKASYDA